MKVIDLRNKIAGFAYGPLNEDKNETIIFLEALKVNYEKFATWFEMNKSKGNTGPFLVGSSATAPDFHLW